MLSSVWNHPRAWNAQLDMHPVIFRTKFNAWSLSILEKLDTNTTVMNIRKVFCSTSSADRGEVLWNRTVSFLYRALTKQPSE